MQIKNSPYLLELFDAVDASSCLLRFKTDIENIECPKTFTFPFYYAPHELSIIASRELQSYLESNPFNHNFGLDPKQEGTIIGKMFGVLVVRHKSGELGYLAGFSGKLAESNHHKYFVPPVFDILDETGFYKMGEKEVNKLNARLDELLTDQNYINLKARTAELIREAETEIEEFRALMRHEKAERKRQRTSAKKSLSTSEYEQLLEELSKESVNYKFLLRKLIADWEQRIALLEKQWKSHADEIRHLKEVRGVKSAALQEQIFKRYQFYNKDKDVKDLNSIFNGLENPIPPAGAGECAAPKLLQYAFEHALEPVCMAEFWWGASPGSEIRKHQHFYPACRGKCEPILGHMLSGIKMDPNPLLVNTAEGKEFDVLYEDEYILGINKPPDFLSVPGVKIQDSVLERLKLKYPDATGPLLVHRLDMSTSGVLLVAKSKEVHKKLQRQFINRSIQKRYIAVLDGSLKQTEGEISLPMRLDIDDRPRQLVCYEHGKKAQTKWECISKSDHETKVYFYPITGRTHQLRVHAAHVKGLDAPIKGDDLYGTKSDRLYLHAEQLIFRHPVTKEEMKLLAPDPF